MAAAGVSCKLCLKYIPGDDLYTLDDTILEKLEFLQLDLEHAVEESNSLCKDCGEKIDNAFNFKACVVNCADSTETEEDKQNLPSTSTGETSAEKIICHLCKNHVDKLSVISLTKLLKDDCMSEVFHGHITEVDLKNIADSWMVCEVCQKSLAGFSTLVQSWMLANDWNEDDTKDDDDFEMTEVKKEEIDHEDFSDNTNSSSAFDVLSVDSASTASTSKKGKGKKGQATSSASGKSSTKRIKTEIDEISDSSESVTIANKDVKKEEDAEMEENEDAEMEEVQLKNEEIEIKDEDGSLVNSGRKKWMTTSKKPSADKNALFKVEKTDNIAIEHNTSSEVKILKCNECDFVTKWESNLKIHFLVHQSTIERRQDVSFEWKTMLKSQPTEKVPLQMLHCKKCSYGTRHKRYLDKHVLQHDTVKKLETFKCTQCSYEAKKKSQVKRHELKHRSIDDVQFYKCNSCKYFTIYKENLKQHLMKVHQNKKNTMYKCKFCSFSSVRKTHIQVHSLKHRTSDKVQV